MKKLKQQKVLLSTKDLYPESILTQGHQSSFFYQNHLSNENRCFLMAKVNPKMLSIVIIQMANKEIIKKKNYLP